MLSITEFVLDALNASDYFRVCIECIGCKLLY